jgi:hypothetical protein
MKHGELSEGQPVSSFKAGTDKVLIKSPSWLKNATFSEKGTDLVIEGRDGQVIVIEGYFSEESPPEITTPDGQVFSPMLVKPFVLPGHPGQYAGPLQGSEPVGAAKEVSGNVTITRTDGTVEKVTAGTPVFEGDVIETDAEGAVDLVFADETSFAVSSNARMAIDEYVYDPSTESGSTEVSMLKGLFIFTSGLIARNDPDDVNIDTPVGSIGIRGTMIAGNVDTGEFTVIEGAIVIRSFHGEELTLSNALETVSFDAATGQIAGVRTINSAELSNNFQSLSNVSPSFFASIDGRGADQESGEEGGGEDSQEAETESDEVETGETSEEQEVSSEETSETESGNEAEESSSEQESSQESSEESAEMEAESGTDADTNTEIENVTATEETLSTQELNSTDTLSTDSYSFDSSTTDSTSTTTDTSDDSTYTTDGDMDEVDTTDDTADTSGDSSPSTDDPTAPPPNEAPTASDASFSIDENSAAGTSIGRVNATDPDSGQTLSYSIESGNDSGIFGISSSTGSIYVAGEVNYEDAASHLLTVKVTDNGTGFLYDTAEVTINVNDVNDAPVAEDAVFSIAEDAAVSTVPGSVNGSDEDAGQSVTYSITAGNTGGAFAINSATGELSVNAGLDRETTSTYNLTVTVTDDSPDNLQGTAAITVNISDVNDNAPVLPASGPFSIAETASAGTDVGTSVTATDADTSGTHSYSIIGGTGEGVFDIDTSTGQISVNGTLDYEATTSYTLDVEVTDGVATDVETYTVNITDVDDETPVVDTNVLVTVDEGSSIGIGNDKLLFNDADTPAAGITYNITSGPANGYVAFAADTATAITSFTQADINAGDIVFVHNGSETAADSFDFEVTDGANTAWGNVFSISVNPVDDAPTIDTNTGISVAEEGTVAITTTELDVSDLDTGDSDLTYTVTTVPLYGQLEHSDTKGTPITTFTQQQIVYGKITYVHDGTENFGDSFQFELSDATSTLPPELFTISITGVNDAPVLDLDSDDSSAAGGLDFQTTFTEDSGPVDLVDVDLSLSDVDSANLQSAIVMITNLQDPGSEIITFDTTGTSVNGSYDSGTGTLTLTNLASVADYKTVLKTLQYENTSQNPDNTARIIQITVNDGTDDSNPAYSNVTITPVNDAPLAQDDTFMTDETLTISGENVLDDNGGGVDSDPEGDALVVSKVDGIFGNVGAATAGSNGGTFIINSNGTFDFDPESDFDFLGTGDSMDTSINYEISDGNGGYDTATVTVTVMGQALDLNSLAPGSGFRIDDAAGEGLGDDIAASGDTDGDGFFEVLFTKGLGDTYYSLDGNASHFNSTDLVNFDTNNPGGYLTTNAAGFSFAGGADTNPPNEITISYIGDFDGDGDADFVTGFYNADSSATDSGQVFIIDSAGNKVMELDGMATSDWLGASVTGVGDINHDGYDDVVVGAPETSAGDGAAYLLYGHPVSGTPMTQDINELGTGLRGAPAGINVGDAFVSGNYMYVIETNTGTNGQIRAYDISDPANPVSAGAVAADIDMEGGNSIWYDAVSSRALATSAFKDEVNLVHFNNPGDPGTVAGWGLVEGITDPIDCLILGSRGFVLTQGDKVHIIESVDGIASLNPTAIDLFSIDAAYTGSVKIDTDGVSVYVLADDEIIEINPAVDPAAIMAGDITTNVNLAAGSVDIAVHQANNIAYVSTGTDQINIIDLGTGSVLNSINSTDYPDINNIKGLYVKEDGTEHYLYAVSGDGFTAGAVSVFDITNDPQAPTLLCSYYDSTGSFMYDSFDVVAPFSPENMPIVLSSAGGGTFQTVDPFIEGEPISDASGFLLGMNTAAAGDFNDDGYQDFVVSRPGADQAHIFLGDRDGILTTLGTDTIALNSIFATTDIPLHRAGDINGEGVSDLAVTAEAANGGRGEVHVFFGNEFAVAGNTIDAATLDGTNGFTITTGAETAHILGAGAAGDFNGDGFDDFVVALKDPGSYNVSLYLLHGGNYNAYSGGEVNYAELTDPMYSYEMEYTIPGSVADPDNFSLEITGAGDINGDGFNDLAIGMPDNDNDADGDTDGSMFVIYGRDTMTGHVVLDNVIMPGPATSGNWKFDEEAGTTATDSEMANDGTLINFGASPWETNGVIGGALHFDGIDDYVDIVSGPDISNSQFTVSTWVNLDVTGINQTILSHGSAGANTELVMGVNASDQLTVTFGGSTIISSEMLASGMWYNVAVTYDSATNERSIYINGVEDGSDITANDFQGTGAFAFGMNMFGAPSYFDGSMDDMRIYGQMLTDWQIEDIASREMDLDTNPDYIMASANYQSLVGNEFDNYFHDNEMLDISMRGGAGNDVFNLTNNSFHDIDGGSNFAGRDLIKILFSGNSIDFSAASSEQISHIEELKSGDTTQTITLSFDNLFDMAGTADGGDFYITAFDTTTHLTLDSNGAVADPDVTQQEFAELIDASYQGTVGSYEIFSTGGGEINVDTVLFSNNQVEVI